MNVTVIDYGVGNLRSLRRGLERAGATVEESSNPETIADAEAVVLPGVGAFEECMRNSRRFHDVLVDVASDTPILGICVGLQLLFTESTEGAPPGETVAGLDLIPGRVERLPAEGVTVPHMGWNTLDVRREHPFVDGLSERDYAYFVHSYATSVSDHTLAATTHGRRFAAIATNERGNVVGTQFHPEKSGETGLALLANFVDFAERWHSNDVRTAVASKYG